MSSPETEIRTLCGTEIAARLPDLAAYVVGKGRQSLSWHPGWLLVLQRGLKHEPYCIEAVRSGQTVGILPLEYVRSRLFGRFLVGLPYLNVGGVLADDARGAAALIDAAVALADRLDVRHLELRHERPVAHPALGHQLTSKVHMRLALPGSPDDLWDGFKPSVRNQVRKGQRVELTVHWGAEELLDEFYAVFARNMRDLGTPVFGRGLFQNMLVEFPDRVELCVVRTGKRPAAAAVLAHGPGLTEVPSASSLRRFKRTNANMLMYWHLLCRSIERGQEVFDFGRSTVDSNTFRFKKQWGPQPVPAVWQYHVRSGSIEDMRPDNARYRLMIRVWQHLPVSLTRLIGPPIVRGIP